MNRSSKEITVRFLGFVDEIPATRVTIAASGDASLQDLLERLFSACGAELRQRLLASDGRLREDVKLVVGGEMIDRLDQKIGPADTVFILTQIAGGC